ncbi:MAG: ATP synthase F1 subunit epsilon [Sphingomonadaceae bacterium]
MLRFELVTPERALRSADVHMVVVPGAEGDFGVLEGHAPLMSTIRPGAIAVHADAQTTAPERIFVEGGLAQVTEEGLTILAEAATPVTELNPERIAQELAAARANGDAAAEARLAAMQAAIVS